LGKKIVYFLLPEAFCRLKYAENAVAAGADPAGGAHDAPANLLVGWGADTLPIPHPTRRLDARAFGASIIVPADTKSWRRRWSPPLFKGKVAPVRRHDYVRQAVN